jgi:tRNA A37 threonylcarbamoyladenosine dehydratase
MQCNDYEARDGQQAGSFKVPRGFTCSWSERRAPIFKGIREELMRVISEKNRKLVVIRAAGALGSQLADNLARQGFQQLRVIDRDCVEEHNVSTQLYGESDVGS